MNFFKMTPEQEKRADYIENELGISTKHVLEVSEAIENDDFTGVDFSKTFSGDELRASCREPNVTMSFTISKSQAKRIDNLCKKRHITRSQYFRNTINKDLALTSN